MKFLIDTHTFLWAASARDKLSQAARTRIEDLDNEIYLSTASLWEIAIKISIGKLRLSTSYEDFISQQLVAIGITILPASLKHYDAVISLPHHHKDPFDRLIIAQSNIEQMPILSIDDKFDLYGAQRIW